jgi:tetratricopeptide (TPR) repeat protein
MGSIRLNILSLLGLALLTAGAGCVKRPVATCPDKGGQQWREVNSPHFRISTNLGLRVARFTALELEQLRAALLLAWGGQVDPPGQVEVIVVRSNAELEEFTLGTPLEAFLDSSGRSPLMVMAGEGEFMLQQPEALQVQAHELAHHITRYVMVRQPRWLTEGLATWLQTVQFSSLRRKASFGELHPGFAQYVRSHRPLSLERLWAWEKYPYLSPAEILPYYASSWLWVAYLRERHPQRFRDFMDRLARAEEPRRAWEEAFQGVTGLEEDLRKYEPQRGKQLTVELPFIKPDFEVRPLDCAEIHTLRARLFLRSPGPRSLRERLRLGRQELEEALKEDPTNVSAVLLQASFTVDPQQRLALARALVQARPGSGPAWSLLGQALQDSNAPAAEQEQALQRALALDPDDVDALVAMAWLHTEKGQTEEGLARAGRAVQLAPGRASTLEAYAALLFQAGRCEESLAAQQRAIGVLGGHVTEALRSVAQATQAAMQRKLAEYARLCGLPIPPR